MSGNMYCACFYMALYVLLVNVSIIQGFNDPILAVVVGWRRLPDTSDLRQFTPKTLQTKRLGPKYLRYEVTGYRPYRGDPCGGLRLG